MGHHTGLFEAQRSRGGRFIDFNGWDMPVQFAGITAEHQTVRTACGVFDLGHMGRLQLQGPDALALLGRQVCRSLTDMRPGQVRYGLVLADDGTVEDDVLVSREGEESFHVVVNAGNCEKILTRWQALAGKSLTDLTRTQAMIAVQGPTSAALLAGLGLDGRHLKYYSFYDGTWSGNPVRLSRTGYTGEDGFECFLPNAIAENFYEAVVAAGAIPCGLGCRDTLLNSALRSAGRVRPHFPFRSAGSKLLMGRERTQRTQNTSPCTSLRNIARRSIPRVVIGYWTPSRTSRQDRGMPP